jgi:signal transduction histidine kinase
MRSTTVELEERVRIARELHDGVSQTLYAITLTAARALGRPNQRQRAFDEVLRLAETGQSELRSLLTNIRSDLTSGGLTAGLARPPVTCR